MKILYVSQCFSLFPTHAASVTTYEIVKGLAKKGHRVSVLVPYIEGTRENQPDSTEQTLLKNIEIKAAISIFINPAQENLLSSGLSSCLLFGWLVVKALRRADYDVVISMYHPTHLATLSAYLIARVLKLPFFVKVHDLVPDVADPHFLRRVYKKALFRLYSTLLKKGDFFLIPSVEWTNLAVKLYKVRKERVILFPNGVDVTKFNPKADLKRLRSALGLDDKKVILYIGRISRIRALDHLISAMPCIVREEPKVRLLIIGNGDEKSALIALSKSLDIDRFVFFLDEINHNVIPSYICLADVAVGPLTALPITIGTLPIKVLEYMACGKPVVACYDGTSKDLIIDGFNGVLINPGEVNELSSALIKLLKDAEFAKSLGANAREHVKKWHDWNVIIEKLDQTLMKLKQVD